MYSGFCLFGWTEWCLCNAFNIPHLPRRKKHLPNRPKKSTNVTMSQCHLSLGQCLFGSGSEPSLERWARPCSDRPDGRENKEVAVKGISRYREIRSKRPNGNDIWSVVQHEPPRHLCQAGAGHKTLQIVSSHFIDEFCTRKQRLAYAESNVSLTV